MNTTEKDWAEPNTTDDAGVPSRFPWVRPCDESFGEGLFCVRPANHVGPHDVGVWSVWLDAERMGR